MRPWQSAPYRWLWASQTLSYFGDHLYNFCVLWWVLVTTGSAIAMSGAMLVMTLPNLLLAPVAGVLIDRADRRSLMLTTSLGYVAVSGAVGVAMLAGRMSLPVLYLATFLATSLDTLFRPAFDALLPGIVARESLVAANGAIEVSRAMTGVLAPALGGLLVASAPIGLLPLLNAASFLGFIVALPRIRVQVAPPDPGRRRRSTRHDLQEAWQFLRDRQDILALIALLALANLGMAPMGVLVPAMIRKEFGLGAAAVGMTSSAFAVGVFLVSQGLVWYRPRWQLARVLTGGIIALGLADLLISLTRRLPVALAGSLLAGAATSLVLIIGQAIFQGTVPDALRGRVFSLRRAIGTALRPVSLVGGGAVADLASPHLAVAVAAGTLIITGCAGFVALPARCAGCRRI